MQWSVGVVLGSTLESPIQAVMANSAGANGTKFPNPDSVSWQSICGNIDEMLRAFTTLLVDGLFCRIWEFDTALSSQNPNGESWAKSASILFFCPVSVRCATFWWAQVHNVAALRQMFPFQGGLESTASRAACRVESVAEANLQSMGSRWFRTEIGRGA